MTRPKVELSYATTAHILKEAADLGATHATLFGYGEPTLDVALPAKIDYAANVLGMSTFITTNGSAIDRPYAKNLLRCGLSYIRFSIHGIDERHDQVQPPLKFSNVIANLRDFLTIRDELQANSTVGVYAMPMCGETVDEIVKFWDDFPIDHLEIWRPHNWINGRVYRSVNTDRLPTCGRPCNGPVQVLSNGDVVPCCFDFNGEMVMGNIKNQSLYAILSGAEYAALQYRHQTGRHDGTPCESCDQRNIDSGDVLLYSSRDPAKKLGTTSTWKVNMLNAEARL